MAKVAIENLIKKPTRRVVLEEDQDGRWECRFELPYGKHLNPMEIKRLQRTIERKFKALVRETARLNFTKATAGQGVPATVAGPGINKDGV